MNSPSETEASPQTCPEPRFQDMLPELCAGSLERAQREPLRAHMDICPSCRKDRFLLETVRASARMMTPQINVSRIVQALPVPPSLAPRHTKASRSRGKVMWPVAIACSVMLWYLGTQPGTTRQETQRMADISAEWRIAQDLADQDTTWRLALDEALGPDGQ